MQVSSAAVSDLQNFFHSCLLEDDFSLKLRLNEDNTEEDESVLHTSNNDEKQPQEEQQNDDQDDEEEFSFVCTRFVGSPISADDIFVNGQIRPVFPLFNRDLLFADSEAKTLSSSSSSSLPLRRLFVEESIGEMSTEEPEAPFCAWTGKAVEASPEVCKKSNSTGFSKLRRFRELVLRSNSDGKDAFVFLSHHQNNNNNGNIDKSSVKTEKSKIVEEKKRKSDEKSKSTLASAHEKLYVRNRAKEQEHKRKSYLPYRVGFFTNVNALSRNIHPY